MKNKLTVLGTVGVPAKYGGFETLVENLLDYISSDVEVTVYCQSSVYKHKLTSYKIAKLKYLNIPANGIFSIFYDIISILRSFRNSDVLLILGVSGAIVLPFIKPYFNGKIIVNIDGLEWKRNKWGFLPKWFLKISEKLAVNFSDVVISDNLHIHSYVLEQYNIDSVLIPYGADHVKSSVNFETGIAYGLRKNEYFFTVCRIEPENNLDMMVLAYRNSGVNYPYLLVGNFNSSKYGVEFRRKYENVAGLILHDPIYDQSILDQFRSNCYYYLHGHSAGGTNPSLVEAMYLGLSIITYGVAYNKATTFDLALYFDSQKELESIFKNLDRFDRIIIKGDMQRLAEKYYTWKIVCEKYNKLIL